MTSTTTAGYPESAENADILIPIGNYRTFFRLFNRCFNAKWWNSQNKIRTRITTTRTMNSNPSSFSTSFFYYFLLLHQITYGLSVGIVVNKFWVHLAARKAVEQSGLPRKGRPPTIKAMARWENMRKNEERKIMFLFFFFDVSCSPHPFIGEGLELTAVNLVLSPYNFYTVSPSAFSSDSRQFCCTRSDWLL